MRRTKGLSAIALIGLLAGPGVGQTPEIIAEVKAMADPVADAVRSHPDVRVAEAKLRVAEAELAQAKLLVAQRVTVAQAKLDDARIRAEHATKTLKRVQDLRKSGGVPAELVEAHEKELAQSRAAVVAAEAELKTAQGVAPGAKAAVTVPDGGSVMLSAGQLLVQRVQQARVADAQIELALELLSAGVKAPPGSAADKLRGLIDKPVKLGDQKGKLHEVLVALRTAAGEPDLVIRVPPWSSIQQTTLTVPAGERSFVAWIDLIFDEYASHASGGPARVTMCVREYGLMVTSGEAAPPGAITLSEFARQVRAEKAARETTTNATPPKK